MPTKQIIFSICPIVFITGNIIFSQTNHEMPGIKILSHVDSPSTELGNVELTLGLQMRRKGKNAHKK